MSLYMYRKDPTDFSHFQLEVVPQRYDRLAELDQLPGPAEELKRPCVYDPQVNVINFPIPFEFVLSDKDLKMDQEQNYDEQDYVQFRDERDKYNLYNHSDYIRQAVHTAWVQKKEVAIIRLPSEIFQSQDILWVLSGCLHPDKLVEYIQTPKSKEASASTSDSTTSDGASSLGDFDIVYKSMAGNTVPKTPKPQPSEPLPGMVRVDLLVQCATYLLITDSVLLSLLKRNFRVGF